MGLLECLKYLLRDDVAVAFQRSEHTSASCFVLGETVTHTTFGKGTVLEVVAIPRADRIKIRFDEHGDKWISLGLGYVYRCSDKVREQDKPDTEEPSLIQHEPRSIAPISNPVQQRNHGIDRRDYRSSQQVEMDAIDELASSPTLSRRRALRFFVGIFAAAPVVAMASVARQGRELNILQTRIAGFAHYKGHQCLPQMQVGQEITLRREPTNRHDLRAIEVYWQGNKIGYVPKMSNAALSQLMDQRERITARLTEIYERSWEPLGFEVKVRV